MAKSIYIITESHQDCPDEFERARMDSLERADEVFESCVKYADREAQEESNQRVDPYWHTYYLYRSEVDEEGLEVFSECINSVTSKKYLRGHETERKHL